MNTIGHAVGDWNSGKKVYPNPEFVNFGNAFGKQQDSIKPFFLNYKVGRNLYFELGISAKEYRKRKAIVEKYEKQGVSLVQLNDFWEKYRLRGNNEKNLIAFDQFIIQQRLLQEAEIKREEELIAQLEEEERKREISDSNLFPSNDDSTSPLDLIPLEPNNLRLSSVAEQSKPNYLLYGGIALAVLVGGLIIYKRR